MSARATVTSAPRPSRFTRARAGLAPGSGAGFAGRGALFLAFLALAAARFFATLRSAGRRRLRRRGREPAQRPELGRGAPRLGLEVVEPVAPPAVRLPGDR